MEIKCVAGSLSLLLHMTISTLLFASATLATVGPSNTVIEEAGYYSKKHEEEIVSFPGSPLHLNFRQGTGESHN